MVDGDDERNMFTIVILLLKIEHGGAGHTHDYILRYSGSYKLVKQTNYKLIK